METINNLATSAAKAVWGESNSTTAEPVSGRVGDTSKGEPYDAGNMEPISSDVGKEASAAPSTPAALSTPTGVTSVTGVTSADVEDVSFTDAPASGGVGKDLTDAKSTPTNTDSGISEDAKFAKETGTAAESKNTPDTPSTDLKAKSIPEDTTKGQDDTRSPEDPKTNPKSAPLDVDDTKDEGINEAQDLDGPGPKPIADIAREHGGDAGNSSTSVDNSKKEGGDLTEGEGDKHESKGTGEEYVRTSGLQADGGDFDATKPGAGREADRLMEEKGMHNPTDPHSGGAQDGSTSPTSGKKSLGQKIKDKLHRH